MGKMPRKDYDGAKNVPANNEVLKRVNTQNAPASLQATGHDLTPDRQIPMTAENIDALVTGQRLLDVSREKFISVVNKTETNVDDIEVIFYDVKGTKVTEAYTRAELMASSTLFIAKPVV